MCTSKPNPTVAPTMIPYPVMIAVFLPIFYRLAPMIGAKIRNATWNILEILTTETYDSIMPTSPSLIVGWCFALNAGRKVGMFR